jgi:aryl-alcohol dehydrogenase-like predicted oxidoreductase
MQYRVLVPTGISVSTVCLGTAAFGIAPLEADAPRLVHRALDLGINFFNTATHYGNRKLWDRPGVPSWDQRKSAEEVLGIALKGHRNDVVITTKVGMDIGEGPNGGGRYGSGLTRRMITSRVEMSLRRLQTDHVDLLYAQSVDPNTPLEVTLRAFDDLVHQGKVLHYGLSGFPAWQMVEAVGICRQNSLNPIIGEEIGFSMANRQAERDLIPACQHLGLSLTAHTALAGGLLAGMDVITKRSVALLGFQRWRLGQGPGFSSHDMQVAEQLDSVSSEWAIPAPVLALGWLLSRPTVVSVITGPENVVELEQNALAGDLQLSPDQIETLDAIGKPA